jgi:hypothetical protein
MRISLAEAKRLFEEAEESYRTCRDKAFATPLASPEYVAAKEACSKEKQELLNAIDTLKAALVNDPQP